MTLIILALVIALAAVVGIVATVFETARDGYHRVATRDTQLTR